jgi:hypothetical protein
MACFALLSLQAPALCRVLWAPSIGSQAQSGSREEICCLQHGGLEALQTNGKLYHPMSCYVPREPLRCT